MNLPNSSSISAMNQHSRLRNTASDHNYRTFASTQKLPSHVLAYQQSPKEHATTYEGGAFFNGQGSPQSYPNTFNYLSNQKTQRCVFPSFQSNNHDRNVTGPEASSEPYVSVNRDANKPKVVFSYNQGGNEIPRYSTLPNSCSTSKTQ